MFSERDLVLIVGSVPKKFTGPDGQGYYETEDGALLKPGEFVVQPALIPAALGIVVAAAEGAGNENP